MTSDRLAYQDLRGFTRSRSELLPCTRSQVHLTSAAVNGLPSCHLTSLRRWNVSREPSSSHAQSVPSSGTMAERLFWGMCWSNKTRLLNTAIIGRSATTVDSSWIDMLAGLSIMYCLRIPPDFWAYTVLLPATSPRI